MSLWLNDGEVLVAKGSGETAAVRSRSLPPGSPRLGQRSPGSPRLGQRSPGSPRPSRGRSPLTSPLAREAASISPLAQTMGKAKQLFVLCDKEGKGFLTKQDMQSLQGEVSLSPEQLETVFDRLDRDSNGFLTPVEFNTGLGELLSLEDTELREDKVEGYEEEGGFSQDPTAVRFVNTLMELGADQLFKDQQDLCSLWCELHTDSPELLSVLEGVLVHAVSHLQDTIRERDGLEQALRRREIEHDHVVRTLHEEMESQIREERNKLSAQDSLKLKQKGQQLEEELKMREHDLENTLSRQKELESRISQLSCEQVNLKDQNQQLQRHNEQLQEQVESSRERLQDSLDQIRTLQTSADQEQAARQRNVVKVSINIKKEKESLLRQLDLLKNMNRNLRDEKDAQQTPKRNPKLTKPLQKRGSIIGNYLLQDKPYKRQLSSDELEHDTEKEVTYSSKRQQPSCRVSCEHVEQTHTQSKLGSPQRVYKVVFLGNSGVGKSSFIQHYCTGQFYSNMSATVGIDFQMKTLTLDSTTITLQLWDTAGQERYQSITAQYYRKADGILAFYDISQPASFTAVRGWMDSIKEKMSEGSVLMLLGNKLDLAREVSAADGRRLAEQHQALFYECSAKTGGNVEELMTHLARMLVTQDDQQCEDALLLTEEPPDRVCCT